MKPVVILDTNALYGRRPFTQVNTALLLALSNSGHIRLVIPQVVLLEMSRQWAEEVQENCAAATTAVKKLNEALEDVGFNRIALDVPGFESQVFERHAEQIFYSKRVEIPQPPEVSVRELLSREIEVRKPFARQGTGFRDALVWETIREICAGLEAPTVPVVFVTNNHKDFCDKKAGNLHPDLQQDLPVEQQVDVVPSLHHLLRHEVIDPLVQSFRVLNQTFTRQRVEELVERAVTDLHGVEVEEALGVYIGDGMYEVPIATGLSDAWFDEIAHDKDTITFEMFRADDELTIRAIVDAHCTVEGFVNKGEVLGPDADHGLTVLEDWNSHVFRASAQLLMRLTFSAAFTEDAPSNIVLTVDEAEVI
ncbi:PIN domain-containing protein [Arthrobacter citreus]|uniref:PIN domain-containing protein n=1 Tax=Arthrobacter citreus TaxID=1670 RepID=UPI0036DA5CB5